MPEPLMKTYLNIPYPATHRAKELGARWDATKKQWYCPDGVDLMLFAEWMPTEYQKWKALSAKPRRRK